MKVLKTAALSCAAALACAAGGLGPSLAAGTVPGWPAYVAMGAVGGPNIYPPTATSRGGDDDFGGRPVDVIFKYAGSAGNGDPGIIDPPTNATRMTNDLTALSGINNHVSRVAIVEYTAQMSGGFSPADFSNTSQPDPASGGTYLMARHLINLSADAKAMNDLPVTYKGGKYYGTLILNPDLMGAIQQGGYISTVNGALPAGAVNTAVDQALCFMTKTRAYLNTSNPNGLSSAPYLNKRYVGTPVSILEQMLADGYPVYSFNGGQDAYWNTAIDNLIGGTGTKYSQVGTWLKQCVAGATYNTNVYKRPNFKAGFEGWVEANEWLIRTFSPQGHVTFGWQDNPWAVNSGFWLQADRTNSQVASIYALPLEKWLNANAPSTIQAGALGASYAPDYFVFDRYESDDSSAPGQSTLYNARSWDNYLEALSQVSSRFGNIPIMMWQIPGSHLPYKGEANPELFNNTAGQYIFSSAPVYFFGDSHLQSNLGNLIVGSGSTPNSAVGNFMMDCSSTAYNCPAGTTYKQYLGLYKDKPNYFNWGKDNGKLTAAATNSHVFAILWGGGNTTSVIKNFSNPDDHGWLANKIITYYKNPVMIPTQ